MWRTDREEEGRYYKKIKRYREMKICRKGLARRGKMRLLNDNLNKLCKLTCRVEWEGMVR